MALPPDNYAAFNDGFDDDSGYRKNKKQSCRSVISKLTDARKHREDNRWDERWSNFIKLYANQYTYPELGDYEDKVAPNMAFSTVNVIVPSIAIHNPNLVVTARREEEREIAEVVEAVANHQWTQWRVQDEVEQSIKDFSIIGHGWAKVTWDTVVEERDLTVEEQRAQIEQALQERAQAIQMSDGLSESDFPSVEEIIEGLPKTIEEVVKDAPLVRRVSPFDLFVDPDALKLKDARWIAQRTLVPLEVARKKDEWKGSVRRKLKGTQISEARKTVEVSAADQTETKDASFVVVWEFYDLIEKTVCVVAEGADDYLLDPSPSPFPHVHPFVMIRNYEVPERFYPVGDVEPIYGLQLELALTRTAMINDRKRGRRVALFRSSALGPDGVEDLRDGKDNIMIDVLEDRPFQDVFAQINSMGLGPEWYSQSSMIQQDIDLVSGVSEYARGVMPEIRRTATEAALLQDAANARSADKLHRVETFMAEIGERMIMLSQMFMDTEDVARVVDENMVVHWVPYTREDLQGDFVFEVEAGSTQPQNETFRRQAAMQLIDAVSPFLQMGVVNPAKVAEHVLRAFGIRHAEEFVMELPPEMGGAPPEEEGLPPEGLPPGMGPEGMM